MFCPKCKCEYRDGITICPDCDVQLVAEIDRRNDTQEQIHPVIIKSVSNEAEAQLVMNLLRNNHINCFRRSREAGDYMRIYMGFSVFGEDIYVDKKDYQEAYDLLNSFADNQEYTNEKSNLPSNKCRNSKSGARIITIAILAGSVLLYIAIRVIG